MRIAITSNGPGEFAGWVRPLVSALYRLAPETDVTLVFVPDDYATGREAAVALRVFGRARIATPQEYIRFALGRKLDRLPTSVDVVQYLGGDLLHAARVRARLGGAAFAYKFARKADAKHVERAFAIDAANAASLAKSGIPRDRITIVGNLAIDGALDEARREGDAAVPDDARTILFMPGTRKHEIANMVPLFLAAALRLRAMRPDLAAVFAISPFTDEDELAGALALGGHRNAWGTRGRVVRSGDAMWLQAADGSAPFAVVREAMRHAPHVRLAVTLPGTKCIELAALGVPTIVCVPLNAPEVVVINGPLQYLDRIPAIGTVLKRAIVVGVDKRFPFTAQPNIDTNEALMPEMRGTLYPGDIARRIAAYGDDDAARTAASLRLRALYAEQIGAAERMARILLDASVPAEARA
ncbi:MAG: hypothetical protein NVS4B5_09010 [Vulcanimicrobiaceae bacterium]